LDLKGDKTLYSLPTVILCLDNCLESLIIFYSIHLAGLIPMVLSPKLPSEQIESIVNEHNIVACFIDNKQKYKFDFISDPEIKKIIVGIKRTETFGFISYSQFIDEEMKTSTILIMIQKIFQRNKDKKENKND
jgi:acyl-CoA synthetase (AMP-forming)/AMP-acid ligase II